jgi:hypothetical protein
VKVNLAAVVTSARMLSPVLRLGGRREAANIVDQLVACMESLAEQLVREQEKNESLMRALTEEIAKGHVR